MRNGIEAKDRILAKAEEMFLKSGYSKVAMGEIAKNAGISKKTLYRFFLNKEELIRKIIAKIMLCTQDDIDNILIDNKDDLIEKLGKFMNLIRTLYSKFDGPLLDDLQKSIPELWQQINKFREENIMRQFTRLISVGVEEGIFRKDINYQLIVLIYISAINGLINYEILSQIPLSGDQIVESIIDVIFRGIFTKAAGIRYGACHMAG